MVQRFLVTAALLMLMAPVYSQRIVGPVDVYVSKQGNNPASLNEGSYTAFADEGRYIKVTISNVTGPIRVEPSTYELMGPPCPTYDAHGRRTPSTPAPPAMKSFHGMVKLKEAASLPAPGTSADAQFSAKDNGYYTRCSKNEKVNIDSTVTVKYKIHSIRVALNPKTIGLCNEEKKIIAITNRYPADKGSISWASLGGKFKIISSSDAQAEIQAIQAGEDKLIATFTVNGATYRDTTTVNCNVLKFQKAQFEKPWVNGGKLDAKTLLTDKSRKDKLEWSISKISGNEAQINAQTGEITYPPKMGGTYTVTVQIKGSPACKATARLVMMGFRIVMDVRGTPCDGEEAALHLEPIPINLPRKALAEFGEFKLVSKTKVPFKGNPADKEKLEFAALDAQYRSKVLNSYWYSTGDACNIYSNHVIDATAQVQGKEVSSYNKPELRVSIRYKTCIEGFTSAVQTFTGAMTTRVVAGRGAWAATVTGLGTFKRAPKGAVTKFKCPANSQFFKLIQDEENYHVGQIEGKNGTLCNDLWLVKNVTAPLTGKVWYGRTAAEAQARVNQAILLAVAAENLRCNNLMVYPPARPKRCALEKEAKAATGVKHGFHMKCAYSLCK